MLKCVPNNGEIDEIHQIWGISSKIQNHSQSRWGKGWPKIEISILDPVFEEISTRSIFCKKFQDFSKKNSRSSGQWKKINKKRVGFPKRTQKRVLEIPRDL